MLALIPNNDRRQYDLFFPRLGDEKKKIVEFILEENLKLEGIALENTTICYPEDYPQINTFYEDVEHCYILLLRNIIYKAVVDVSDKSCREHSWTTCDGYSDPNKCLKCYHYNTFFIYTGDGWVKIFDFDQKISFDRSLEDTWDRELING